MFKHKHNFENGSCFIIEGKDGKQYPRLIKTCKKCGIAIHVQIYTQRELEILENDN